MTQDRRNDLGGKMSWFLIAAMVAGFSAFAWAQALKGEEKADKAIVLINEEKIRIAVLETNFQAISFQLSEIKLLIKTMGH